MALQQESKPSFWQRFSNKYRLVVLNDETFEEKASFKLSRFNLYVLLSTILFVLVILITSTLIFTPLKYYIPGYGDINFRKQLVHLQFKTDSLEQLVSQHTLYNENIMNILNDNIDTAKFRENYERGSNYDTININKIPEPDLELRKRIDEEESYSVVISDVKKNKKTDLHDMHFFTPIKGFITSDFEDSREHYGVDIVAPENEPIKTVLDGTVISTSWTLETGHVIAIQHENNLISLYKHNSVLLKKVGNFVKAGDVIAIIGNSGELSTGPHLHFELWHNGVALNPTEYIFF